MVKYEGVAVMYMGVPMTQQSLPLKGCCSVNEKKLTLKFPLTSISFELPKEPCETEPNIEFKISFDKEEMQVKIKYNSGLHGFLGEGVCHGRKLISFVLYDPDGPLRVLNDL